MEHRLRALVGICGGIAAYKVCGLIRLLKRRGVDVKAVLTPAARNLVGIEALRTLSENTVFTDEPAAEYDMPHIRLAEWADCMLICPATANTIAKVAHGIGDNLLSSLALSFVNNLIIAPAMNTAMWLNPATQDNLAQLKKRGVRVLPVGEGELACGGSGPGRLLDEDRIVNAVLAYNLPQYFRGKKILIASGPTWEPLDPVRMITNRSSGKMGAALAAAALTLGAEVTVVSGPAPAPLPSGVGVAAVTTAAEMQAALEREFTRCDICIMAAAIADFRPATVSAKKISIDKNGKNFNIACTPNPDIAAALSRQKKRQFLVCFALEQENLQKKALQKIKIKGCDMIIANYIADAVGKDTTTIRMIVPGEKSVTIGPAAKQDVALKLLTAMAKILKVAP